MFGGPIPEEYGGAGLDYISYAIMNEEISKACSSVRTVLSVQLSLVATTILKWGSEAQKKKVSAQTLHGGMDWMLRPHGAGRGLRCPAPEDFC